MESKSFLLSTMGDLDTPVFEELKKLLIGDYITFAIVKPKDIKKSILAEKLYDYFGTLEIKTGTSFDKELTIYMNSLNAIVEPHIAKTPPTKKGDTQPSSIPRARKYYEKVVKIKDNKKLTFSQVMDYSRIMLCLYAAIIKSKKEAINNFDYSLDCLNPKQILRSMKKEEVSILIPPSKKQRFNTEELYSNDTCTLIITALMLCAMANRKVERDDDHE